MTDAGWDGEFDSFDDRSFVRSFGVNVTSVLHPWQNPVDPLNVDALDDVKALDVLLIINAINRGEAGDLSNRVRTNEPYYDVNGDDLLAPLDALLVINAINRARDGEGEESNQPAVDISQTARAVCHAAQDESHAAEIWSDMDWLWDEEDIFGPKKWRTK